MLDKLENKYIKDEKLREEKTPLFKQSIEELKYEFTEFQKKYKKQEMLVN
jgi:hypothetical protein